MPDYSVEFTSNIQSFIDELVRGVGSLDGEFNRALSKLGQGAGKDIAQDLIQNISKGAGDASDILVTRLSGAFSKVEAELDQLGNKTRRAAATTRSTGDAGALRRLGGKQDIGSQLQGAFKDVDKVQRYVAGLQDLAKVLNDPTITRAVNGLAQTVAAKRAPLEARARGIYDQAQQGAQGVHGAQRFVGNAPNFGSPPTAPPLPTSQRNVAGAAQALANRTLLGGSPTATAGRNQQTTQAVQGQLSAFDRLFAENLAQRSREMVDRTVGRISPTGRSAALYRRGTQGENGVEDAQFFRARPTKRGNLRAITDQAELQQYREELRLRSAASAARQATQPNLDEQARQRLHQQALNEDARRTQAANASTIGAGLASGTHSYVRQSATSDTSGFAREAATGNVFKLNGQQLAADSAQLHRVLQTEAVAGQRFATEQQVATNRTRLFNDVQSGAARVLSNNSRIIERQGVLYGENGRALQALPAQRARQSEAAFNQANLRRVQTGQGLANGGITPLASNPNLYRVGQQRDLSAPIVNSQGVQLANAELIRANQREVEALQRLDQAQAEATRATELLARLTNGTARRLQSNQSLIQHGNDIFNENGQQLSGLQLQRAQAREEAAVQRQNQLTAGGNQNSVLGQGVVANFLSGATGRGFGGSRSFDPASVAENLAAAAGTTAKYTALYSALGFVQNGLAQVAQESLDFVDSQTELSIALGKTHSVAQGYINDLGEISRLSGDNVGEAMDTATRGIYALSTPQSSQDEQKRAGYNTAKYAAQLQTVTGKASLSDATGDLLASANAYDLQPEQLGRVNDAVIGAAHGIGGDAGQISQGLANIAPLAKEAGFSIDEAADLIALSVTRLDETGNTAASRLSRVFSILGGSQGKNAIRDLNAGLAPDKQIDTGADVKTQIDQLADAYPNLTKAQQDTIKQQLGGTTAIRELDVVLSEHGRLLEAFSHQADNAGKGEEAFKDKVGDLTGVIKNIVGDLKNISVGLFQSGAFAPIAALIKVLEPALHTLSQFLNLYNELTSIIFGGNQALKQGVTLIAELALGYKLFQSLRGRGLGTAIETRLFPSRAAARAALAGGGEAAAASAAGATGASAAGAGGAAAAGSAAANASAVERAAFINPSQARIAAADQAVVDADATLASAKEKAALEARASSTAIAASEREVQLANQALATATTAQAEQAAIMRRAIARNALNTGATGVGLRGEAEAANIANQRAVADASSGAVAARRQAALTRQGEVARQANISEAERRASNVNRRAAQTETRTVRRGTIDRAGELTGINRREAAGTITSSQAAAARLRAEATYDGVVTAAAERRALAEGAGVAKITAAGNGAALAQATAAEKITFSQLRAGTTVSEALMATGRSIGAGAIATRESLAALNAAIRSGARTQAFNNLTQGLGGGAGGLLGGLRNRLAGLGGLGTAGLAAGGAFVAYEAQKKQFELNTVIRNANNATSNRVGGTNQDAVAENIATLKETAKAAREASSGLFGTIMNAVRPLFGGERTDNAAENAEKEAAIEQKYLDKLKALRDEAVRTGNPQDALDLSSTDSLSESFKQLQESGASAHDQMKAIIDSLADLGTAAQGGAVKISSAQAKIAGAVGGRSLQTQIASDISVGKDQRPSTLTSLAITGANLVTGNLNTSVGETTGATSSGALSDADFTHLKKIDLDKLSDQGSSFIESYFQSNPNFDANDVDQKKVFMAQLKQYLDAASPEFGALSNELQQSYLNGVANSVYGALRPGNAADLKNAGKQQIVAALEALTIQTAGTYGSSIASKLATGDTKGAQTDVTSIIGAGTKASDAITALDKNKIKAADDAVKRARVTQTNRNLTPLRGDERETKAVQNRVLSGKPTGSQRASDDAVAKALEQRKKATDDYAKDQATLKEITTRDYSKLAGKGQGVVQAQITFDILDTAVKVAHAAGDTRLETQLVNERTAARLTLNQANQQYLQQEGENAKAYLALTDTAGANRQDLETLKAQRAATQDPAEQKKYDAAIAHQNNVISTQSVSDNNARSLALTNPNNARDVADAQGAADTSTFAEIARQEQGLTEHSEAYWNAWLKMVQDNSASAQAQLDHATAVNAAYVNANSPIDQAQEQVRQGLAGMARFTPADDQYWQYFAQYRQAQRALAEAVNQNISNVEQLGEDITNPLVEANQATRDAQRALQAAKADPNATADDINAKQLDLIKAQNSEEATRVDTKLGLIQSDYQLQRIGSAQYLSYLRKLRDTITGGSYQADQERRKIDAAIKEANSSLSGMFNLGDIKVPTVYQVRRANAAATNGTPYSQNQVVTVNISGISSTHEVAQVVKQQLGQHAVVNRAPVSARRVV